MSYAVCHAPFESYWILSVDLCPLRTSPLQLETNETKQTVCVCLPCHFLWCAHAFSLCSRCAKKPDIVAAGGADRHHAFGPAGREGGRGRDEEERRARHGVREAQAQPKTRAPRREIDLLCARARHACFEFSRTGGVREPVHGGIVKTETCTHRTLQSRQDGRPEHHTRAHHRPKSFVAAQAQQCQGRTNVGILS